MKRFIKSATTSEMLDTFEDELARSAVPKRSGDVESATDISAAYYDWEDEYENGHPEWERIESKDVLEQHGARLDNLGQIVESGSNANGTFVRYSDGTQICWGIRNVGGNSIGAGGNILFPLPVVFASISEAF